MLVATGGLLATACFSAHGEEMAEPQRIDVSDASRAAVTVEASDFKFAASTRSVKDGTIDFVVTNVGTQLHEFVIVPKDDERFLLPLGEIEPFPVGDKRAIRAQLAPGSYELVCLIVSIPAGGEPSSHMALGMRSAFEVTK